VQPNRGDDEELLELAQATERVARNIADPVIKARLHAIAADVRAMASHRRNASNASCQVA
jgi:hypothetical protein